MTLLPIMAGDSYNFIILSSAIDRSTQNAIIKILMYSQDRCNRFALLDFTTCAVDRDEIGFILIQYLLNSEGLKPPPLDGLL